MEIFAKGLKVMNTSCSLPGPSGDGDCMVRQAENGVNCFDTLLEVLRYAVFIGFYVLSIRVLFVTLTHAAPTVSVIVGATVAVIVILSWWRVEWALYGFMACIPVVSGFQVIGFMKGLPLLSIGFASIYLTWLCKHVIREKKGLVPGTRIGNLVDVLSAIVLISLIMQLVPYPVDFIFYRLWFHPFMGQNDFFYGIEGSYVLLQGLFFYRVMELEIIKAGARKRITQILFIQASIIIFFSILQLISKIPMPLKNKGILFSPFDDIHSYGSYIALFFFVLVSLGFGKGMKHKWGVVFAVFLLTFIFLSTSFATLGATFIVGCIYVATQFRFGKIAVTTLVCLTFAGLLFINLNPSLLDNPEKPVAKRYARGLIVSTLIDKLAGRFLSADQSFGIMREFPITGSGVGTFYRISRNYHFSDTPHPRRIENAHNYYLQLSADLGIPALLIFLGIIFYTGMSGFKVLQRATEFRDLVKGLLFGLCAYLITMLAGHPLLLSNQQFLFWFVIAAISIAYRDNISEGER